MPENAQGYSRIILRVALGIIFFTHGAQKLLGWFGGFGFDATVKFFQTQLGIPPVLVVVVTLVEFLGGIFLLLGMLTRVFSVLIAIDMLVALLIAHLPQGFFIARGKVGFEYVFTLLFVALYLAINGAGTLSLDRLIRDRVSGSSLERLFS